MRRFHVHVSVDELSKNIRFYSAMFGTAPTVEKADYAKWMLDDPRVNFAVSRRGSIAGVDHLGFQVDDESELKTLREQVASADIHALDEAAANCCYAKSDKYWTKDPQGIAWETFHTLGDISVYGERGARREATEAAAACCVTETTVAFLARPKVQNCG